MAPFGGVALLEEVCPIVGAGLKVSYAQDTAQCVGQLPVVSEL